MTFSVECLRSFIPIASSGRVFHCFGKQLSNQMTVNRRTKTGIISLQLKEDAAAHVNENGATS